jgi:hypothetical protein
MLLEEAERVAPNRLCDCDKFDDVDPALSAFHFGDE